MDTYGIFEEMLSFIETYFYIPYITQGQQFTLCYDILFKELYGGIRVWDVWVLVSYLLTHWGLSKVYVITDTRLQIIFYDQNLFIFIKIHFDVCLTVASIDDKSAIVKVLAIFI